MTTPVDQSDRILISRIRNGEADAWRELIARFEGRLFAFVHSRLANRATSEDVVQETLMGFLVSLPNYDENRSLETFLFTIAAHKLTDTLRREGRRPAIQLAETDDSTGPTMPPAKTRRASAAMRSRERQSIEETIVGECLNDLIQTWINRNEFERLQCIELLFVLGWPNKDAANSLGISEQAVANHKHFVVAKLKEAAQRAKLRDFDLGSFGVVAD